MPQTLGPNQSPTLLKARLRATARPDPGAVQRSSEAERLAKVVFLGAATDDEILEKRGRLLSRWGRVEHRSEARLVIPESLEC